MAAQLVILVAIALLGVRLFLNWRKLASIPGPFLAKFSDLWRAYYQYRGQLKPKLVRLHKKYGPVVRYGVNCVSFSDPSAIDAIYGSRAGFVIADSYKVAVGIANGKEVQSLLSMTDEAKHMAIRRSVTKAFSPVGVLDYESWVDQTIPELIEALSKYQKVDLSKMMLFFSMDSATRFSFGEELGCLRSQSDISGTIKVLRNRVDHWGWWSSIPSIERLVFRNPIAMRKKTSPSSIVVRAATQFQSRKDVSDVEAQPDLLQRIIKAGRDTPHLLDTAGIISLLITTISAAGDTSATTMAATIYLLLTHPTVLSKLASEIKGLDASPIPTSEQVNKLPYLNAVIKETMRLYPILNWPSERKVPAGGATICGKWFKKGTSVGVMTAALHSNPAVFGADFENFRPERWIEGDPDSLKKVEAAFMGFSRGRRVCLGQHIAWMQMKKVVALLVRDFEMSLVHPEKPLEVDVSGGLARLEPLYVSFESKKG